MIQQPTQNVGDCSAAMQGERCGEDDRMIGTCFENGRNVTLLSSHLSLRRPLHMSVAQETQNTPNTLCYLCDRVLHDEHVRHVAELAEVLAQFVLTGLPTEAPDEEFARGGVGGGGGAAGGLPLAAQLVGPGCGRGERQPGQLVHRESGEGKMGVSYGLRGIETKHT